MYENELFIEPNLPPLLTQQEQIRKFLELGQGSMEARQELIKRNIRLVIREVRTRFNEVAYDQKELISIGIIGLIKAVDAYDLSKKFAFSTFAVRCIDNEILMFLRKLEKDSVCVSLETSISVDRDGSELRLEDILWNDNDLVMNYEEMENQEILRKVLNDMPDGRNKEIMLLFFGFYNDKRYSQREIAQSFNLSQTQVSRIISKNIKELKEQLETVRVIDLWKDNSQRRALK